jgi:hypothetical protein
MQAVGIAAARFAEGAAREPAATFTLRRHVPTWRFTRLAW